MRKKIILALAILAAPSVAYANPIVVNPTSFIAFWVVVVFALVVEAGIASLVVTVSGMSPVRVFLGFLAGNALVYFIAFRPLLERGSVPIVALELGVVSADAMIIKFLSAFAPFQNDNFTRLSWLHAIIAAGAGNAFSYFIGRVASSPYA